MKTKLNVFLFLMLPGILTFTSCEKEEDAMPMDEKNIVEVAAGSGQFTVLIQAAQKAGLAEFLGSEPGITVFAPTDDAFAMFLSDLGLNSLDEVDEATLGNILKYHVVSGMVYSTDLSSGAVPSLNNSSPDANYVSLLVNVGSDAMVNNAKVTSADVMASNGIIHVIDKVLLPPTVVDLATYSGDFSSLVGAVVRANLAETLSGDGPFTVFAPTNDAFDKLFSDLGITGLDDVPVNDLTSILTYHVVGDNVLSTNLSSGKVGTVSGKELQVSVGNEVMLNGNIKVTAVDIQGTNGVIHAIDNVLIPE